MRGRLFWGKLGRRSALVKEVASVYACQGAVETAKSADKC